MRGMNGDIGWQRRLNILQCSNVRVHWLSRCGACRYLGGGVFSISFLFSSNFHNYNNDNFIISASLGNLMCFKCTCCQPEGLPFLFAAKWPQPISEIWKFVILLFSSPKQKIKIKYFFLSYFFLTIYLNKYSFSKIAYQANKIVFAVWFLKFETMCVF